MRHKNKAFKEILILELEDLDEDIRILIEQCNKKFTDKEISNYVCLENIAVLQNELFGVEGFIEDIKNVNPEVYESLDAMIDGIKDRLYKKIKERGLVRSIEMLVERKCGKVRKYLEA